MLPFNSSWNLKEEEKKDKTAFNQKFLKKTNANKKYIYKKVENKTV